MDVSLARHVGAANAPVTELAIESQLLVRWGVTASPSQALIAVVLCGPSLLLAGYLHRQVDRVDWTTVAVWSAGGVLGGAALGLWIAGGGTGSSAAVVRAAIGGAVGGGFAGTEISRTRSALATSDRDRRRWKSLFAKAPTAVADLSIRENAFSIVAVNDEFRTSFPIDGDYEGQQLGSVVDLDDIDEDLNSAVEAGTSIMREFTISSSGDTRYYRLRLIPYQYDDAQRAFAIVTEGTSLKKTERDLQEAVSELSKKNDRLEQFASVVSHDLRNPLNVATGHLELMDAPGEQQHREKIATALGRIESLISDLLTLAREGRAVDDLRPVRLDSAADGAWETVDKGEMELNVNTDAVVLADGDRLQQLFENLFRNAREHAGNDATVAVGDLDDGDGFFVSDDGPGIPADEHESVFEPGHSSKSTGTGLGLDIVRAIARGHDWRVDVTESSEGGARFEFRNLQYP
ncbi:sensor histidine kinase [Halosimplex marinum]|uniref:sensor histidine kinase n=1 Tax=Halosimplex marinum TaxID=3396620 RepID=UPI003F559529